MNIQPLAGTPNQIAWGNKIRQEALGDAERNAAKMRLDGNPEFWVEEVMAAFVVAISKPERLQASWWIDHRKGQPIIAGKRQNNTWEMIIQNEMQKSLRARQLELAAKGVKRG